MTQTTNPEAIHLPALDGVRGLAITVVLFAHAAINVPAGPWPSLVGRAYFTLCSFGWIGVDLFFVLSGFLITRILIEARQSPGYFRNFYARRALRIFPLYYGVLALLFLLNVLVEPSPSSGKSVDSFAWLWFYVSNIGLVIKGQELHFSDWYLTGHFWSLAVEEQFYLIWPVVVLMSSPAGLRRVCLGFMVAALVLRIFLVANGASLFAVYLQTPCKMDTFAAGAWLACAVHAGELASLVRPARWVALGGVVFLAILGGTAFQRGQWYPYDDAFMRTLGLSMLWAFFGSLLVLALAAKQQSVTGRFFSSAPLRWLGKYSYGIYVFHGLLAPLVVAWVLARTDGVGAFLQSLAYILTSSTLAILVAWCSWHLYERHWLRLKRFFPSGAGVRDERKSIETILLPRVITPKLP